MTLSRDNAPRVLMACPTYSGMAYALPQWAEAYKAQTYPDLGSFQVDNSDGPAHGGNLHYTHCIRGQGIDAVWQKVRFPHLWDTLELGWRLIVEHAKQQGYDFIFSVEADVIVPPDATEKMVLCSAEHMQDGKPAVVTQRYHPRGQAGPNFWWDTLGCSLFPVEPLYAGLNQVKAIYEIEAFITLERAGYPRYRPGHDGDDLFVPDHLKDPDDSLKQLYGASPAPSRYTQRVMDANAKLQGQPAMLLKQDEAVAQQAAPAAEVDVAIPMGEEAVRERPPELAPQGADLSKPYAGRRVQEDAKPLDVIRHEKEALATVIHEDRIRLNVGSGYQQISGFQSVDFDEKLNPDVVAPIDKLPFPDDSVDEIYASHVLEHVPMGSKALEEWLRVLKPGGMLTVAVPDIVQTYYLYKHGGTWGEYNQPINENYINAVAFGANLLADDIPEMKEQYGGPGHRHQQIFIHDMLLNRVIAAGFVHAHEVSVCFLRKSALGETMVQAQKPAKGE